MSILDEKTSPVGEQENFYLRRKIIPNSYFNGLHVRTSTYSDLTDNAKEFIILLLSYELNFEPDKLDYYYRTAKTLQSIFQIPGWGLVLPHSNGYTKKFLKKKIINLANEFKRELIEGIVDISALQAKTLNKAYKNFLWD